MTTFIGIDPGLTGAVAAIREDNSIRFYDTPTGQIGKKTVLSPAGMREIFMNEGPYDLTINVAIEAVHSMPKQGVASSFSFGKGVGLWLGILAGLQIPYTEVPPQRWKALMMHGMGKDKDASRIRAMQLFPQVASELKLKKHHGRADALLLAEYLRKTTLQR